MKVKKLNLEVYEGNFDKKSLCDVVNEVSKENKFMFFRASNGYKHTDHNEYMDGVVEYTDIPNFADYSYDKTLHEWVYTDHNEYLDRS